MSDAQDFGFGKFVPGFDFLQNLTKGASQTVPQMPNLANWIAPTLNLEELDKRINELKAVHFWLDQNSRALGATVQALEVQRMTLSTLKGMNFNMGELANVFKLKAVDSMATSVQSFSGKAASSAKTVTSEAEKAEEVAQGADKVAKPAIPGLIDPMQLWTSLTQQFQQIAAGAIKEAGKVTAMDMGRNMATEMVKETMKATKMATDNATATANMLTAKKVVKKVATKTTPSSD